jgi:iron-sulfur cluster assembly protein
MLTLTPSAEEAVRQIVAAAPVDDDTGGLRIAPGQPTPDGVPLEMSLVDAPEESDQDAGSARAHVYLEPSAAEALDDKVLDAEMHGEQVGFAVRDAVEPISGDDNHGPTDA